MTKKPTQTSLAEYIGFTQVGIAKMKKNQPKKFEILWIGWLKFCEDKNKGN